MDRKSTIRRVLVLIFALALFAVVPGALAATGDFEVYQDETSFVATTGATAIGWPADAATALPLHPWSHLTDYSCAVGSLVTPGGDATVTNTNGSYLCYIGADWNAGSANTNPKPVGPTIVNNGEDDYNVVIELAEPVEAIGFGLLTNKWATETVKLYLGDGTWETIDDSALGTDANALQFVGFSSDKLILKVEIDTTGGASQNEGITGIWMAPYDPGPTTSCPDGQVFVDSHGSGSWTPTESVAAATGYPYELTTSGTYFAGGRTLWDIQADAKYSQDADQRAAAELWTDLVNHYESYGPDLLEMKVDGVFVDWGAFSADHSYTIPWKATGTTIDFQIYDIYAQNNTGGLCVDVEAVPLRSINGGGQIIADSDNPKKPYKVSFGGHLEDIDGGLVCEWQVNLHNVNDSFDLDKAKFHTTDCFNLTTWKPGEGADPDSDGVARFYANGTLNGDPGYCAIFRMEDYTEPSVMDTLRIEIYNGSGNGSDCTGSKVFETSAKLGGDFPAESDNVGTARTYLDRGNIQIKFYE